MTRVTKVRFSPKAERWFLGKIAEIAREQPSAARNILRKLEKKMRDLSDFPRMTERGLIPGTRKISLHPFILTARIRDRELEIVAARFATQKDALEPSDIADETNEDTFPDDAVIQTTFGR